MVTEDHLCWWSCKSIISIIGVSRQKFFKDLISSISTTNTIKVFMQLRSEKQQLSSSLNCDAVTARGDTRAKHLAVEIWDGTPGHGAGGPIPRGGWDLGRSATGNTSVLSVPL